MDIRSNPRRALAPGALSLTLADYHVSDTADSDDAASGTPTKPSAAAQLPTEVIQQILYLVNPETFASLVLVNRAWRKAADDPQIYAYHLSRCPSFAATNNALAGPFTDKHLGKFKKLLVQEAKRNLFAVFLRPQQTIINLISTTTSSSAAFPNGEGYEFIFSQRARYCLALSSSRIYVLDTGSPDVSIQRELKVVRRPLSACILADGSMLAVLAANHRVNLYDLKADRAEFKRSIELDETAHTITMTLHGEILAAGCEGGVEVVSLAEHGPQAAKRVIKCDRIDNLAFSDDGTMLLGTTRQSRNPSTVILTAPYFTDFSEHDMGHTELLSHLWTSQIIFPNGSRDCSHAALLPRKQDQDNNWTLTYDRVFESFRAVRSDDLRNGTTYFTGPEPRQQRARQRSKSSLTPKTLPAITTQGDLVAAAFLGSEIWLYGVPEELERPGVAQGHGIARMGSQASSPAPSTASSPRSSRRELERLPRWQVLVDKYRNAFAKGRKVANVSGASSMCWYAPAGEEDGDLKVNERLVIAAPGGVTDSSELDQEDFTSVDGGRLFILDFSCGPRSGKKREITIELEEAEPQLLEEENMDMDTEIAVARRRTLARREGVTRSTVSSVAGVLRPAALENAPPMPPPPVGFGLDSTAADEATSTGDPGSPGADDHGVSLEEAIEGLDAPYSHTSPRSRGTVYRSAEAVEANRRRNPPHPASNQPVQYRRTDGTELPHESDADNWVPPPPAYGKHLDDDAPSDDMRRMMMPLDYRTSDSPTAAPSTPTRATSAVIPRPARDASAGSPRLTDARRRSSADVEGSRWFSRHQDNRSASPALNDDAARAHDQPSPSAPAERRGSRPISGHDLRASIYRAALQPPASISPIAEPDARRASPAVSSRSSRSDALSSGLWPPRQDYSLLSGLDSRARDPVSPLAPNSSRTPPPPRAEPAGSQIRRHRTTPASATSPLAAIARRPLPAATEPTAYQLNQLAIASASSTTPFGVGTEAGETAAPRRRMPRLGSFPRRGAAPPSPPPGPPAAFDLAAPDAVAEYSSRRSNRKSRRADAGAVAPLEHAPLQQPLDVSAGPVRAGGLRPTSSGRPTSRLSQRLFSRRRPLTEDPAALAAAGERIVPAPAARADAPAVTRALTGDVPAAPSRGWERSPMRAMGAIREDGGERRAIEGALRGAYPGFEGASAGDQRRARQRARTDGAVKDKARCDVM